MRIRGGIVLVPPSLISTNAGYHPVDRPITPFILSLLGGLLIVAGGVFGLVFFNYSYYPYGSTLVFAMVAITTGIVVLAGCAMLYQRPDQHVIWGVLIVVFSVMSLFSWLGGLFGGFFVGMVLGIVGGCLGIAWNPGGTFGAMPRTVRFCQGCGRYVPIGYPFCPFCGTPAPVWRPPATSPEYRPPTTPP
ncbi:MAG: DUF6114 domain-containing protein [Candidatus Thermoplasmatota archaeon]